MLNRWQRTVVDPAGNIVPGAILMVRRESDQALVTVYKDREGTQAYPLGQVTANSMGYAYFYAPADLYRITSATPAIDWRDVDIGAAAAQQIAQQALDSAMPTYETLLDMQADTGQGVPTLGRVVNATDPADNGYYVWDGVSWERSSYQPASDADVQARLRRDQNLADLDDAAMARGNLGLGTAAVEDVETFATAAQGIKADTAVQPERKVEGGDGLAGGGDLSENRIITLSGQTKYDLDQIYAQLRRAEYGDGPYPVFDQVFGANARFLDPRITLTRPGKSWRTVNGVLREYDVDEPCLTGDGWSVRPAETNLLKNSDTLEGWVLSSGVRVEDSGIAALGSDKNWVALGEGVDEIVRTHYFGDVSAAAIGAGVKATASMWVRKMSGGRYVGFLANDATSSNNWLATIDPATGDVGAAAGATVKVIDESPDAYRFNVTYTTAATTANLQVRLAHTLTGAQSYQGDGRVGAYIFGVQFNTGDPIPYIPTTTTAVTRPADNASIQGAAFAEVFNPMEGAIIFDVVQPAFYPSSNGWMVGLNDGTLSGTGIAGFYNRPADSNFNFLGNAIIGPTIPLGTRIRGGLRWDGSAWSAALNGAVLDTKPIVGDPANLNQLWLGGLITGSGLKSIVSVRRLTIFNRRPSDAQMEALTS